LPTKGPILFVQPTYSSPFLEFAFFIENLIDLKNYFVIILMFCYREHLAESLGQEGGAGTRVVEKFLELLQLVMAEPGASFKRFVPSTVSLCLDHVYPLVCILL